MATRRTMRMLLSAAAALAAAAAASAATTAAPAYTAAQLAIMVLPEEQVGPDAEALDVSIGSGQTDNAAGAEETLDPKDTGPQLARAGRVTGYSLDYDEVGYQSFKRGRGLLGIGSSVELFTSGAAADAYLEKQLRDALRYRGKYVEAGLHLAEFSTFPVKGIGTHALGARQTITFGAKRIYTTSIAFRVSKLIGGVAVTRADAAVETKRAARLARQLAERIRLVEAGKLKARPVAVPPIGKQGRPPRGGPDLEPLVLSIGDLPSGATVARQGYVADDGSLASYEREFSFLAPPMGGPTLASVESDLSLFRTPTEAAGFFFIIRTLYDSPDLVRLFGDEGLKGAKVELHRGLAVGDEAIAVVVRANSSGQEVRLAQVFVRSGRTVGVLTVAGLSTGFGFDSDVRPLAARFAQRMKRA